MSDIQSELSSAALKCTEAAQRASTAPEFGDHAARFAEAAETFLRAARDLSPSQRRHDGGEVLGTATIEIKPETGSLDAKLDEIEERLARLALAGREPFEANVRDIARDEIRRCLADIPGK